MATLDVRRDTRNIHITYMRVYVMSTIHDPCRSTMSRDASPFPSHFILLRLAGYMHDYDCVTSTRLFV